jgi:hypothetical protein
VGLIPIIYWPQLPNDFSQSAKYRLQNNAERRNIGMGRPVSAA